MPVDEVAAGARGVRRLGADLTLAVAFLTILPVRVRSIDLGRAAAWFPAVGALVGGVAGAMRVGADPLVGPTPASALAVVALVVLSGAFHQDGLADTVDGLGVRDDRERRLAVMRDPAVGAFGVLALIGWAVLLVAALAPLGQVEALATLIAAGVLSRWAALVHAAAAPPARADGLGAAFHVRPAVLAFASACAVVVTAMATLLGGRTAGSGAAAFAAGAVALAAALAIALLSALSVRRAIGGRTGDTLGATVAVAEVAVALTLLAFWR